MSSARFATVLTSVLTFAVPTLIFAAGQAPSEVVQGGRSGEEMVTAQRDLQAWLGQSVPARPPASPIRVDLTPAERTVLRRAMDAPGVAPRTVGIVRTLSPAVTVAGFDRPALTRHGRTLAGGTLAATNDGGFVWSTTVTSVGAARVRVHLSAVHLPPNVELYVFGNGDGFGPYVDRGPDGDGEFWTPSVNGSAATLLVRHAGPATEAERRRLAFTISAVGHVESRAPQPSEQAGTAFCGNPDCIVDASCLTNPAVTDAMQAVAQLEWVSGPFLYTCTGGLLADTDPNTQIPYLLTAHHCLSRSREAKNLEAFFFYRTSSCGNACPANDGFPRTLGATVKATGSGGDFTLLQLAQTPPAGSVMLGWNASPVATVGGLDLYRISHPNFGPQTYAHHQVDTSAQTCTSWPRGERIYSRDIEGATDGGSSGSPVLNAAGQVVGQLSGGCGTNVHDVCDATSNATVDGALAYYFQQVAPYLDPSTGSGCVPTTESCTNGIDDDCDGLVDCADGDCAQSLACTSCTPAGAACTVNAECCSGNCKGRTGRKTCK